MGVLEDLASLRALCIELHDYQVRDPQLGKSLSGLYYAFKSLKFVTARTDDLLSGTYADVVSSSRADEACYLAESMLRSLHPVGDLLAQAVNLVALKSKHGRGSVSLATVLADTALDARTAAALTKIRVHPGYDYIQEFTNATKHREFIERAVLHDDNHHRIEFQPFTRRNGRQEPRKEFSVVVTEAVQLMSLVSDVLSLLVEKSRPWAGSAPDPAGASSVSITATAQVPGFAMP